MPTQSSAPWMPVKYGGFKPEVAALQAMKRGEASPDQQVRAMNFILENVCCRFDMSFRPGEDGARASDFAEGKRYVANQIVRLVGVPLSEIPET